jgi:hypothetical protein
MDHGADASGEASGQGSRDRSPEGRWVTYEELGHIRGIGRESAVKLVQRKRWRRTRGNDGEARVCVPLDWLVPTKPTTEDSSPAHSHRHSPDTSPDIRRVMAALEAAITAKDVTIAALAVRAERAEGEADRLVATVQIERARAEGAEAAIATERTAREEAEAALATAEAETAALRQADQQRRPLGLMARLRAAWRGE